MATKRTRKAPAAPPETSFADWSGQLTRRERWLEEILGMMLKGAWLSGVSDTILAKQWGCSPPNVRQIAAEANRVLRARLRDDDDSRAEARAQLLQMFEVIRAKAMAKGDPASLRVALDALRAYGFYLGIEPAKQLDVTQRKDDFKGWTTDEKLAYSKDGTRPRRATRELAAVSPSEGEGLH